MLYKIGLRVQLPILTACQKSARAFFVLVRLPTFFAICTRLLDIGVITRLHASRFISYFLFKSHSSQLIDDLVIFSTADYSLHIDQGWNYSN